MSTQSAIYRSRLKSMIELIKGLHPLLPHIPSPLPRPGSPTFSAPKVWDAKKAQARQEEFEKRDQFRLDSSVAPYWLQTATDDTPRRGR